MSPTNVQRLAGLIRTFVAGDTMPDTIPVGLGLLQAGRRMACRPSDGPAAVRRPRGELDRPSDLAAACQ